MTATTFPRSPIATPLLCALAVTVAWACPPATEAQEDASTGRVPGDTWLRYATPEEAGWSSERIAGVKAFADSVGSGVGMLIHDGAVVTSWGDVTQIAGVSSLAKALNVMTVGIGVERGDVDLDATLGEVGIEDEPPLRPCERDARVRHLLAMKSGVYHPAPYSPAGSLPERCSAEPGEQFVYHNWDMAALTAVFEKETGATVQGVFWEEIARPLGLEDTGPATLRYVVSPAESRLRHVTAHLSARDLARVGLLMLRDGGWAGRQLVPASWLERMRSPQHRFAQGHAVGWLVWLPWQNERLREMGAFLVSGSGLNVAIMVPERNVVFVHRAHPLNGGVHGRLVNEELLRLLDARTGEAAADPALVPFEPGG